MVVTIGISPAIAKRAGERHGGRAWAGGKLNEGATFYFARFCSIMYLGGLRVQVP